MLHHKKLTGRKFWILLVALTSSALLAWPFVVASGERNSTIAPIQGDSSFIRQIPLRVNDLVYNPTTQLLYGSVPSTASVNGNSIVSLNPTNGTVNSPVFIGSEPTRLTLSDDGQSLYASLEGSASVRRFNVSTHTAGTEFQVGQDSFHGIYSQQTSLSHPEILIWSQSREATGA